MERLKKKFITALDYTPKPELVGTGNAEIGIIAYGSTEMAVLEAIDTLGKEGIEVDFLRIRSLPLHDEVIQFIEAKNLIFIPELNRDGQMWQILNMKYPRGCGKMKSVPKHDGLPLTAAWLTNAILEMEAK